MKRKVNLYILSVVLLISILLSGVIVYNVSKQMNAVIGDEKKQLTERVIAEFTSFERHVNNIEEQVTYTYRDKVIKAAEYLNRNWENANEIPFDTLRNLASRIDVIKLVLIERDGSFVRAVSQEDLSQEKQTDNPEYESFLNKLFSTSEFLTYNIFINPDDNRMLMHSYYAPKNSSFVVKSIINLENHLETNNHGLLKSRLYNHIKDIIPKVNKIVRDVDLFNIDDTNTISLLNINTQLQLNTHERVELLNDGLIEIRTKDGERFYSIIEISSNIGGLPNRLILFADFDYSVRYRFAQNILIYIIIIIVLLILIVSFISPVLIDNLLINKIKIINYNLNALRLSKYNSLKPLEGNDELSIIAENIEYVKDSVIERERQLRESMGLAEAADKLKSAFLANMSHEIRTPLNAVVGFAQLLRDVNPSPEDVERYVGLINSNSNKLLQIINDIIDLSQIESGQLKIINRSVCLQELFTELYAFAQSKVHGDNMIFGNKSINVFLDIESSLEGVCIISDPYRLKQIMEQLIDNAIKFSCNGYVKIGFKINDDFVELFVSDTGTGIAEDNITKIFDRFVQIEDYMTREYGGTGLGLAICNELVGMLGGSIHVDSKLNEGSTFLVKIPYLVPKC